MGWLRGDLVRPVAEVPSPAPARAPVQKAKPEPLQPGDAELLKELEILLDLDLLEGWDPDEDLPIPLTLPPPGPKLEPE